METLSQLSQRLTECIKRLQPPTYAKQHVEFIFHEVHSVFTLISGEKHPTNCDEDTKNVQFGPIFSTVTKSNFLNQLVQWSIAKKNPPADDIKYFLVSSLLCEFDFLISQSKQNILYSASVLQPLVILLDHSSALTQTLTINLSRLLKTLCVLLCRDTLLLNFTKQVSSDVVKNEYLIFSKLVPLLHLQGVAGTCARDAILLILSLSDRDLEVAAYLTSTSDICPVLATGLSGLYSSLPKRLAHVDAGTYDGQQPSSDALRVHGPGWHRLTKTECRSCEPLMRFLLTLDFCNLAVRISHSSVRKDLLFYIYSGFLTPVVGSALHQHSLDEVIAAEAYLELFLRRLTEPALIGLFLRFVVASNYDNCSVLSTLIGRIKSSEAIPKWFILLVSTLKQEPTDKFYQLGMVTLSLFRTILNLNCEDAMYILIFRYLNNLDFEIAGKSVGVDRDCWFASANQFIGLTSWSKPFEGENATSYRTSRGGASLPSPRLATSITAARHQITRRTQSTSMWSSEYSHQRHLLPTPRPTSGHPLILDQSPNLHSTPLRPPLPLITSIEPPSPLDQYKSKSDIYQLSYLDDESDSEVVMEKPDMDEDKSDEAKIVPEKTPEEPAPVNLPLAAIRRLLSSIGDSPSDEAVPQFVEALREEFGMDVYGTPEEVRMPYPEVDEFTLQLLDYRLGRENLSGSGLPQPLMKRESLAVASPLDSLSLDEDMEIICKREMPELPFEPIGDTKSPSNETNGDELGPFLGLLLSRLRNMHKHSLYANLLLTDIFVILASFQQFPLAELLLRNTDFILKYPSRSLYQVLAQLRTDLENALSGIPKWVSMLKQAMRYLEGNRQRQQQPEKVLPSLAMNTTIRDAKSVVISEDDLLAVGSPTAAPRDRGRSSTTRAPPGLTSPNPCRRPPIRASHVARPFDDVTDVLEPLSPIPAPRSTSTCFLSPLPQQRRRNSSIDRLQQFIQSHLSPRVDQPQYPQPAPSPPHPSAVGVPNRERYIIYAYIIFNEFCLELAGLCCEHGVSFASALPHLEKAIDLEHALAEL